MLMIKIFVSIFVLCIYAHLYVHFIVNPNNECTVLNEMKKEDITNAVYTKQPFIFDARDIKKKYELKEKTTETNYSVYDVSYESIPSLEPYVRFFPCRKVFECRKKKRWVETNKSCRSFYRIEKGMFNITCIHPKYKSIVESKKDLKKELKDNKEIIHLTLHQDSIISLPTYWHIYIDPLEKDSILEKIQYYTPLNRVANAISKIFN